MSWRDGSTLFIEMWPLIERYVPEQERRIRLTADLVNVFAKYDMDTWCIEDVCADVRKALVLGGHRLQEPELYADDVGRNV